LRDDLSKFPLQDLADGAHGKRGHHLEPLRQLEGRDLLRAQMGDELVECQLCVRVEDDTRARLFAEGPAIATTATCRT
jgi:hypothetical protein